MLVRSMRYAIERQKLESMRRELEHQRDEFFSSVSHDLRTPVAAIKAAVGVAPERAGEHAGTAASTLGNIDQAADELATLIEDLLRSRGCSPTASSCGARGGHARRRRAGTARGRAALSVAPPTRADHAAARASPGSGGRRTDRACCATSSAMHRSTRRMAVPSAWCSSASLMAVCVSVADQGPIPAADQERIFERFYRVASVGELDPPKWPRVGDRARADRATRRSVAGREHPRRRKYLSTHTAGRGRRELGRQLAPSTRPCRMAYATTCARFWTCNLSSMLRR